jgi:hypothetical protein
MSDDLGEDQYHVMVIQVKGPLNLDDLQEYVAAIQAVLDQYGAEVQRKIRVLKERVD